VRFWDFKNGNPVYELAGSSDNKITSVKTFGDLLLTNCRDNVVRLFDIRTYKELRTFRHDDFKVGIDWAKAVFSPDGKYIAAGSTNGSIFIWNSQTGALETTLRRHNSVVCGCNWSVALGFVSCDKNKTIVLWD